MQEAGEIERTRPGKELRLWPGVLALVLQWGLRFGLPALTTDSLWVGIGVGGALLGGLLVLVWWAFLSRAPGRDRLLGVGLFVAALLVTPFALHESLARGMTGMLFPIFGTPVLCLALVGWAFLGRGLADGPRRLGLVVAMALACAPWTLLRTGGFTGYLDHDFAWRWSATPEDRLLEAAAPVPEYAASDLDIEPSGGSWPGFRGPGRDAVVRGLSIETDWEASPPELLWRQAVGPGWSSFAAADGRVFTQEQRGEDEVVSCYALATGEPLWMHRDPVRFWESNAGAGPRATPVLDGEHLFTLGATGIVNALVAATGERVWTRDAARDTGAELPEWGFSGSPLVAGELVLVPLAGHLIAYDRASGEERWRAQTDGGGYSSPQLLELGGVPQVVFLSKAGAIGLGLDGAPLWEHEWEGEPIVQPARTAAGDLLVNVHALSGLRRLAVRRDGDGWAIDVRWTSIKLKPYYNDFVLHEGHAYGVDGGRLGCIELEEGARRWKGGRYGHGQLLLLEDQGLLLVLGEEGELALVAAEPEAFREVALTQAIEGKTWNHPGLVGDVLLVRNAEEMAALRLKRRAE